MQLARSTSSQITAATVHTAVQMQRARAQGRPIQLSSSSNQWHTPPSFLQLVKDAFQGNEVDLDPCSDERAQQHVQAAQHYTVEDNGLSKSWTGRVFVNPPFGTHGGLSLSGAFFEKAMMEYQMGHATEIILLLKAAIGYAWFWPVLQWPHAWLHRRVSFLSDGQSDSHQNPHGSVVVYMGPNIAQFFQAFKAVASIPGGTSWSMVGRH